MSVRLLDSVLHEGGVASVSVTPDTQHRHKWMPSKDASAPFRSLNTLPSEKQGAGQQWFNLKGYHSRKSYPNTHTPKRCL